MTITHYNDLDEQISKESFTYSEDKTLERIDYVNQEGQKSSTLKKYGNNGFVEKTIYLDKDENQELSSVAVYNKKGLIITLDYYSSSGEIGNSHKFKYNEKDQKIEHSFFTPENNETIVQEFEYDRDQVFITNRGVNSFYDYTLLRTFDENDNLVEEVKSSNWEIVATTRHDYEYDNKENWVKKITYKGFRYE